MHLIDCNLSDQLSSAMLAGYGSVLTYATGAHTSGMIPPPGTIFLAATPGAAAVTCTVLLVSNLNEEVRSLLFRMCIFVGCDCNIVAYN